ncbi:uncharacterized protein ATNIH1004_002060 [Aspergillus tanneri]|uniref:Uncharacterized protein n=1 Tax=Aspergillus tanneri TaxID=1220188 RepID=A0A5M9M9N5_9EURO|nr:uncharacterized protein ATNIH1004_002060 [Aspergillus tanneri]KAA8641259.1 hypothetical protein ATNIH1004_002060 [Aspergillus tanneri]
MDWDNGDWGGFQNPGVCAHKSENCREACHTPPVVIYTYYLHGTVFLNNHDWNGKPATV